MAIGEHFAKDRWVDYTRGLSRDQERTAMEGHLSSGCTKCRRTAELLGKLAAAALAEAEYQPPPSVLRRAKAIFPRPGGSESAETPARILARLIYDSFRDPLPAGMRAGDRPSQALFEAEDYSLDLHLSRERVDRERGEPRMVLVGQIADRKKPGKRMADLPVLLVSGRRVAARGVSNEMGEFHLEYDPRQRLRLRIPVAGRKHIEIPLPRSNQWGMP